MKWSEHEKVRPVLFAPTVVHRGVGVVEERKGYTVRTSGDVDKLVPHEYECPVHGRFTVEVKASDVPDEERCPVEAETPEACDCGCSCSLASPWCGSSQVGIGISSGEVTG